MAISDLLWMCPECGEDRGLVRHGKAFRCRACGTVYRRGNGSAIVAERPDGSRTTRAPLEWLAEVKDPQTLVPEDVSTDHIIRAARVQMARVVGQDTVRDRDGYLNQYEIWGDEVPGDLEVHPDYLVVSPDDGGEEIWPLETLTAVQASSHSLQLNRQRASLASFRFADDSVFLWEELLHAVLSAFYRRTGRGEIVEFQPRIVTR